MPPIKKILQVKNIGRFLNGTQKGPELNRYNLFFAENGRGKTTLCAVLRSLQTGEHEHITERKTVGFAGGDPAVEIRLANGNAKYGNNTWNVTVPEIAIFDATFVARNVHAGEYVDKGHRSNLLEVIIGEAGVTLAEQVNALDTAIREKNSEIGKAKKAIEQHLPAGVKLEDFLELINDPDIDTKIRTKAAEHSAAKQADQISKKAALAKVPAPVLPEALLTVLAKTLDDIAADAETRLKEHVSRHEMHDKGQAWIAEGLGYLRDDACPFCGQDAKGLPLIEAYKQFFSQSYKDLVAEIDQLQTDAETALGETALATMGRTFSANEAGGQFWKSFVDIALDVPDYDGAIAAPARALRQSAISLIEAKQKSPLSPVMPDEVFKAALEAYEAVCKVLDTYNSGIASANETIAAKKKQAENADPATVENELAALRLVKLRYDPKILPLCTEYLAHVKDKDKLVKDKDAAKKALDDHADAMIRDYETTINTLLKGFGAGFTITNSRKTYIGGTPSSVYQILINNQPIDLGDGATPLGHPCFRTTLSAGDKSTLALAFFLAQLAHDPGKQNRIVIFDDPFNSQDRSRRERTAELLKKCGHECAQLILLSHDPFFLDLVYAKLPKAERHTLQLSRAADNATTIEEWDVKKETQGGYFKDHAALSSFLINGAKNHIDIVRKIRPVLEGYHRYRFPHQFPETEWLGDMIKRIRDTSGGHPMSPALEELEGINDYSKKYHHDTNPGKADNEPIDDGELQGFVRRTLAIVGGY